MPTSPGHLWRLPLVESTRGGAGCSQPQLQLHSSNASCQMVIMKSAPESDHNNGGWVSYVWSASSWRPWPRCSQISSLIAAGIQGKLKLLKPTHPTWICGWIKQQLFQPLDLTKNCPSLNGNSLSLHNLTFLCNVVAAWQTSSAELTPCRTEKQVVIFVLLS